MHEPKVKMIEQKSKVGPKIKMTVEIGSVQ